MDTLKISGKTYISAGRAAKENGYHSDYIGQLIRGGKLKGQKVGRVWYVSEDSLREYVGGEGSAPASSFPEETISEEQAAVPQAAVQVAEEKKSEDTEETSEVSSDEESPDEGTEDVETPIVASIEEVPPTHVERDVKPKKKEELEIKHIHVEEEVEETAPEEESIPQEPQRDEEEKKAEELQQKSELLSVRSVAERSHKLMTYLPDERESPFVSRAKEPVSKKKEEEEEGEKVAISVMPAGPDLAPMPRAHAQSRGRVFGAVFIAILGLCALVGAFAASILIPAVLTIEL